MGSMMYLWLSFAWLFPHGDVHQQIVDLTNTIARFPDSTQLYLERGELYLLHEEINEARADFSTCLHSGLQEPRTYLGLSKSLYYLDLADSSLYCIDRALELDSTHYASLEWKGFLLLSMEQYCASAETYHRLLALALQPSPALFIDASLASRQCPDAAIAADQILISGMTRVGRLHVLEKELVRIYLGDKRYNDALRVQTEIIEHWPVKAKPYYDRAEIYLLTGDKAAAADDLKNALLSIDRLPAYKSSTEAMKEMRHKILLLLNQTGS